MTEAQELALKGEVVDYDIYHLADKADVVSCNTYVHLKGHSGIGFIPDTVIDLGGNRGFFSRFARSLWPKAKIIAVEPSERNCAEFRKDMAGITLIQAAIGRGQLYYYEGENGAQDVFLSKNSGYKEFGVEPSKVKTIMLTDLIEEIQGKAIIKIDIEGSEIVIFEDEQSMQLLSTFDYIAMELHYFAQDGDLLVKVKKIFEDAFDFLRLTHNVVIEGVMFYAKKR